MTAVKEKTVRHRYLPVAPRKMRLLADLVKGLTPEMALAQLAALRRPAAVYLIKLIKAGVAAVKEKSPEADRLQLQTIKVDEAGMLKRRLIKSRGRSSVIRKRRSHLTLTIGVKIDKIAKDKIIRS